MPEKHPVRYEVESGGTVAGLDRLVPGLTFGPNGEVSRAQRDQNVETLKVHMPEGLPKGVMAYVYDLKRETVLMKELIH